jgi:hypothetical protein
VPVLNTEFFRFGITRFYCKIVFGTARRLDQVNVYEKGRKSNRKLPEKSCENADSDLLTVDCPLTHALLAGFVAQPPFFPVGLFSYSNVND